MTSTTFDSSDSQFEELLSRLVVHVNRALRESPSIPAISLALTSGGAIEEGLGIIANVDNAIEVLTAMQSSLQDRARSGDLVAICIAYPDYEAEVVVAYLENLETYCIKVEVPVRTEPTLSLDVENLTTSEGTIFVFGDAGGEA